MIKWSKYRYDYLNKKLIEHDNINLPNKIDIDAFIKKNRLNVDNNYRNEVLQHNGGIIEGNLLKEMELLINGKKQIVPSVFSVSLFLGFVENPEYDIANLYYNNYRKKKLLPIAMDTKGDLFFMDCNKRNSRAIYFEVTDEAIVYFDETIDSSDESFESKLYKIANNFLDFLKLIQWMPEEN